MRTRLTLRPGERGTKKVLERYGERLLSYAQIVALGLTDRLLEGSVPAYTSGATGRSAPVDALQSYK